MNRQGRLIVGGQRTITEWTLNVDRDYLDVTAFGDTTRTYLVDAPPRLTINGTTEQGEDVRISLGHGFLSRRMVTRDDRPIETQTTIAADATVTTNDTTHNYTGQILFDNATVERLAVSSTTNTPLTPPVFEFQPNRIDGVDGTIRFRANMTPDEIADLRRRLTDFTAMWENPPQMDPEQRERLAREREERARVRARDQVKAYRRSMKLLKLHLDDAQIKQLDQTTRFVVKGQVLTYSIYVSYTHARVYSAKPIGDFCINPRFGKKGRIPGPDQALALKLMIEADEAEFLRTGNWTGKYKGKTYTLARMGIDGVVKGHDGYASRLYGMSEDQQPKSDFWGGFVGATLYENATINEVPVFHITHENVDP